MPNKKRVLPPRVQLYFTDANGKKTLSRIENISKRTGLSVSKVASMAVHFGITEVEDRLLEEKQLAVKK